MRVVPFLLLLVAAAAIIAGVVVVAMGRGGELMLFQRDLPRVWRLSVPVNTSPVSAEPGGAAGRDGPPDRPPPPL